MYLKSIEMQGFKSFANKIVLDFHTGITGIVGPNGSGKSNVSDAVRWVLGEQSAKQLRSENMQDVIFSGTENRRPLGYAYVSITLDNSDHVLPVDFQEVTVSRRVYRSGESEYLINGAPCRLREVNELFYDTGIGLDRSDIAFLTTLRGIERCPVGEYGDLLACPGTDDDLLTAGHRQDLAAGRYHLPWEDEIQIKDGSIYGYPTTGGRFGND